jgi:hypothetical protein
VTTRCPTIQLIYVAARRAPKRLALSRANAASKEGKMPRWEQQWEKQQWQQERQQQRRRQQQERR